jgi:hypothetical protein
MSARSLGRPDACSFLRNASRPMRYTDRPSISAPSRDAHAFSNDGFLPQVGPNSPVPRKGCASSSFDVRVLGVAPQPPQSHISTIA